MNEQYQGQQTSDDVDNYVLQAIHQGKVKMVDVARAVMDKKINYGKIRSGLNQAQIMDLDKQLVGLQQMQKKLTNPYGRQF